MENLKEMVDVNTIVGEPVETSEGSVIIPISKVGFGYASGGSDFNSEQYKKQQNSMNDNNKANPFGGGSGGGVSINPVAFLVLSNDGVQVLPLDSQTHIYERLIDSVPQLFEKIQSSFRSTKNSDN